MISRRARASWAAVFLAATASLVSTGALLPVLDAELYADGAVIEAEHDAGVCAVAHNHALCMVWAGAKLQAALAHVVPPADPPVRVLGDGSIDLAYALPDLLPANSRAPPTL